MPRMGKICVNRHKMKDEMVTARQFEVTVLLLELVFVLLYLYTILLLT